MKTLFDPDLTFEEAEELIKNGADVNEQDDLGNTALFYVENLHIAHLLIKHGANINQRNHKLNTPLVFNLYSNSEFALFLINNGGVMSKIENYRQYRKFFTKEQQKAFGTFMCLTSNDEDFFQMCLAYQEGIKNNVKMDVKDMDII